MNAETLIDDGRSVTLKYGRAFADDQLEAWMSRDGYVVTPMLSAQEIDTLTKLYWETSPEVPPGFYSTAFMQDGPVRRHMTETMHSILEPHIARLMPGYELRSHNYVAKSGGPGQPALVLHQDFSFVDQSKYRSIHLWIPMLDVTEDRGCLTVVPGSHRAVNHISAMSNNPSPYDPVRPILNQECTIPLPMKAGECCFFDERLVHGSRSNEVVGMRIAVASALLPRGVQQLTYVVDDNAPTQLIVLEIRDQFSFRYKPGTRPQPPYSEGVTRIGTHEYVPEKLSPESLDMLRIRQAEPPQPTETPRFFPPVAEKPSLFSRLIGR